MLTEQCLAEEGLIFFPNVSFKVRTSLETPVDMASSHLLEMGHLPTPAIGKANEIIHPAWLRLNQCYPLNQWIRKTDHVS